MLRQISNYLFSYPQAEPSNMQEELDKRSKLFPNNLSDKDIKDRKEIILNRDNNNTESNKESILGAMVKALQATEHNSSDITFDFRYYQKVHFASMIFSNISDYWLPHFLRFSKFSQEEEVFILFNINEKGIKIIQGTDVHDLDKLQDIINIEQEYGYSVCNLPITGLTHTECVLNVSHVKSQDPKEKVVWTNCKFNHQGIPYSIIAEDVSGLNLDLRAASTYQEIMAKISSSYLFTMNIYSLKNSHINGGKETSGYYSYVDNRNMTGDLDKFQDSIVACYSEPDSHHLQKKVEVAGNIEENLS